MSLASLCNQLATIKRKTSAAASASNVGGHVNTLVTVYEDVPVSLQPKRGSTFIEAGKRQMDVSHIAYSPDAIELQAGDQLVVDSVTYLVQSWGDMAGRGSVFAIYLLRKF